VHAATGHGAWLVRGDQEPEPARVSETAELSKALFCTTSVRGFEQTGRRETYDGLQSAARLTRGWGDCFGYTMVATGRADFMVDPVMNVWDAAALQPILEEAGGTFTDWNGNPTIHGGEGVAANPNILDQVLEFTRGK
ncbi:MAG: histidinol phosphate phosphatase, partial [Planctomycetales bacterium]